MKIAGSLFCNESFEAIGTIWFSGANIGNQMTISSGKISNVYENKSINIQDILVKGPANFENLECIGDMDADGSKFEDRLTFANLSLTCCNFILTSCYAKLLCYDGKFVDLFKKICSNDLLLDGFIYSYIKKIGQIDGRRTGTPHLELIEASASKQERSEPNTRSEFRPQPHTQLANVLRAIGHEDEARDVLYKRDLRLGAGLQGYLARYVRNPLHRRLVGYGHHPYWSLGYLLGMFLLAVVLSHIAWKNGDFVPNSDVIITSQEWRNIADSKAGNPAAVWSSKQGPGQDWATFNAFAWGADAVLPVVSLGQVQAWTPATNRGTVGQVLVRLSWFFTIAGGVLIAALAVTLTGFFRRR